MANPSKAKGTAAETAVVRYLRDHGFGGADRQPLRGNRDAGDIALCPGVILEVKRRDGAPALGQPPAGLMAAWLAQTETERANAGADLAALVVARSGTRDVGRWWAYVRADHALALMGADIAAPHPDAPLCMSVASLCAWLRAGGYGDAWSASA